MNRLKYPKTYHFEWSPGVKNDDRIQKDLLFLTGQPIIITEKMDGECTTLYNDYIHARSIDSNDHESRSWVKQLWGNIKHDIPENWRICGENLYAKHSIPYTDLESYFMVFQIWDENNNSLPLDERLYWCDLLNLTHVPILHHGLFDIDFIKNYKLDTDVIEGFVVSLVNSFNYNDFNKCVVKWVRSNHIQSDEHWMKQKVVKNLLKK